MKKASIRIVNLITAALFLTLMCFPLAPAAGAADTTDAGGFVTRTNALRSVYPGGKYWSHMVTEDQFNGDNLHAVWKTGNWAFAEQFADSVTDTACYTHEGTCPVGHYDCNVFDGGLWCWGFARKIFFDVFGIRCSALKKDYNVDHVRAGSYVRLISDGSEGHSVFVLERKGNIITVVECNYAGRDMISWDRQFDITKSRFLYCYNAPNFDQVNRNPAGVVTGVKCTLAPACAPDMRLDVSNGSTEDMANIQIYASNKTPAQEFTFEEMGDGYFRLITAYGKAVDLKNNHAVSEETVWQYGCNNTDAQLWRVADAGDGYVCLIPKSNPSLRLDVKNQGTTSGTDVQVYWVNQTPAQQWRIRVCY